MRRSLPESQRIIFQIDPLEGLADECIPHDGWEPRCVVVLENKNRFDAKQCLIVNAREAIA